VSASQQDALAVDRTRPPAPGPLRPFHFPPARRGRLPNGLEVVVAEAPGLPVATLELVFPGGARAEPPERAGLASFVSSLLESGAGERGGAEVAETVDALGLDLQTGISWDVSSVGLTALRARLEPGVALLADLVQRPTFPADEVDRIREERLSALAQRRADPGGLADELALHYLFADGVPYGRRLTGVAETLGSMTRTDARDFHAAHFRPVGATLVAAGDVTLEEVEALAERCFGGWEGAPPPLPAPAPAPRYDRTTLVLVDRADAVQSEVRVVHPGVPRDTGDYVETQVMNAVLGGTFASRLNLNLRERLGYTYGINSSFTHRRLFGTFSVSSAVQSEGTVHAVSEILREMRGMREAPVKPAELDDARSYLAGVFPLTMQTTSGLASRLTTLVVYGLPDDYWDGYRERILAVGADDALRAARERLHPEAATVVVVGDAKALRAGLEALEVGPVVEVDPAEVLR
jgi:zinc protease